MRFLQSSIDQTILCARRARVRPLPSRAPYRWAAYVRPRPVASAPGRDSAPGSWTQTTASHPACLAARSCSRCNSCMGSIVAQFTQVLLAELRPLRRMCVVPLAQFVRRSDVFEPDVQRRRFLRETSSARGGPPALAHHRCGEGASYTRLRRTVMCGVF